jgi:hypothetical protein
MPPSGARWPVRHGLASLSATSCRSPCRCASSSCKALAIAGACSLATFVSASASSASACSAFARALCGLRLRPVPGVLAQDPPPGLGASFERTCSALDRDAAGQPGAVRKRPHACDSHDHTVLPGGLGEIASTIAGSDQEGKDKRSPAARALRPWSLISRRCAGPAAAGSRAGPARRAAAYPHGPDRRPGGLSSLAFCRACPAPGSPR